MCFYNFKTLVLKLLHWKLNIKLCQYRLANSVNTKRQVNILCCKFIILMRHVSLLLTLNKILSGVFRTRNSLTKQPYEKITQLQEIMTKSVLLSRLSVIYFSKSSKIALKELDPLINFIKNELLHKQFLRILNFLWKPSCIIIWHLWALV